MSGPANSPAAQFDRVASAYATSAVHARGADLELLVEAVASMPDWRVLDVGTGAGHAAMALAPRVAEVTALDIAANMLVVADRLGAERGITNLRTVQADARAMPFPAGHFDAAVTRFSAHHWSDPDAIVRETARVLRPGAPFVVIDSISPAYGPHDSFLNALEILRDPSHGRNGSVEWWRTCLGRHGFQVEEVRTWPLELDLEEWMRRSATVAWRAGACRRLLAEAAPDLQDAFVIKDGGARFSLPCALIKAVRA